MRCQHDWRRATDDAWWTCDQCAGRLHPSWTPETRATFETGCAILQLELTKPEDIVARAARLDG